MTRVTLDPVVIVHLSDLHLDGGARAADRARRVVNHVRSLDPPPDVVLVTGDLADHGLPREYAEVRQLLAQLARVPVLVCPGNHDVRRAFSEGLAAFSGPPARWPVDGPLNGAFAVAGVRFLLCDSSIPGRDDGLLDDATLDWLEAQLAAEPERVSFVCFHHPPVPVHVPAIDRIRQFGADRLAEVLARHPQVPALLCGHAHTAAVTTFAGRPVLVAPGVVSTLLLPAEGADLIDPALPPGLTVHLWHEGRLTSHVRSLPMP